MLKICHRVSWLSWLLLAGWSGAVMAAEVALSADKITALVNQVNDASNRVMLKGSTVADVDALFALYSPDFVYVHEVYGGTYSRQQLYNNSLKNLKAGRFQLLQPRYQLLQVIPGLNAAAVQRREFPSGQLHLTVFEFKGGQVAKVIEYWQ